MGRVAASLETYQVADFFPETERGNRRELETGLLRTNIEMLKIERYGARHSLHSQAKARCLLAAASSRQRFWADPALVGQPTRHSKSIVHPAGPANSFPLVKPIFVNAGRQGTITR